MKKKIFYDRKFWGKLRLKYIIAFEENFLHWVFVKILKKKKIIL